MKLALGVILMVLGIIGIARGSVGYATTPKVSIRVVGENSGNVPVAPLASSVLFVGGLIILAKTVKLRVEDLQFPSGGRAGMLQRGRAEPIKTSLTD